MQNQQEPTKQDVTMQQDSILFNLYLTELSGGGKEEAKVGTFQKIFDQKNEINKKGQEEENEGQGLY